MASSALALVGRSGRASTATPAMQDVGAEMSRMQPTLLDNMGQARKHRGRGPHTGYGAPLETRSLRRIGTARVPRAMGGNFRFGQHGHHHAFQEPPRYEAPGDSHSPRTRPHPARWTASEDTLRFFDAWTGDYFRSWTPAQRAFLRGTPTQGPGSTGRSGEATTGSTEEDRRYVRDENPATVGTAHTFMKVGNRIRSLQDHIRKDRPEPPHDGGAWTHARVAGSRELADKPELHD